MARRRLDPEMAVYMALELAGISQGSAATWPAMNSFAACTKEDNLALEFLRDSCFPPQRGLQMPLRNAAAVCRASNAALLARPLCAFEPVSPMESYRGYPAQDPEHPDDVWGVDEGRGRQFEWEFRHPGDDAKDDDPSRIVEVWSGEDTFQALSTVAARGVYGLAFAGIESAAASSDADGAGESKTLQAPSDASPSNVTEMHAGFPMQFLIRFDLHRKRLVYDCYEAVVRPVNPDLADTLPTKRDVRAFADLIDLEPRGASYGYYSDEEEDDDEEFLNEPVEISGHSPGSPGYAAAKRGAYLRASLGTFLSARQFRIAVPLECVVGVRLHAPSPEDGDGDPDLGRDYTEVQPLRAALVLELGAPITTSESQKHAFAVRTVKSKLANHEKFNPLDADWTPGHGVERSSRHYIFGEVEELRRIAAVMAASSPRIAAMLDPALGAHETTTNTLIGSDRGPPIDITYRGTPAFLAATVPELRGQLGASSVANNSLQAIAAAAAVKAGIVSDSAAALAMPEHITALLKAAEDRIKKEEHARLELEGQPVRRTKEEIYECMRNFADISDPESHENGFCLMSAWLQGTVPLPTSEAEMREDMFFNVACINCGRNVGCTQYDALMQPNCGGFDYGDGNLEGALQCGRNEYAYDEDEDEDGEDGCGHGMYLSCLCFGRHEGTSGKFFNHCTECPDFGTCMGDYRNGHCQNCGAHYFRGSSGFACTDCGAVDFWGAMAGQQQRLAPGPASVAAPAAWPGLEGDLHKIYDAAMARRLHSLNELRDQLLGVMAMVDPPDDAEGLPG